jgi:hypothetical protein
MKRKNKKKKQKENIGHHHITQKFQFLFFIFFDSTLNFDSRNENINCKNFGLSHPMEMLYIGIFIYF